jgi:hypothetical protein
MVLHNYKPEPVQSICNLKAIVYLCYANASLLHRGTLVLASLVKSELFTIILFSALEVNTEQKCCSFSVIFVPVEICLCLFVMAEKKYASLKLGSIVPDRL